MSYVQRRRFLWVLFLLGLALVAVVANATTLARMRFEELARQATAVARVRCLGAESRWENGEIWTETRFEVVEQSKGELPGIVTIRMLGKRRQSPFANRGCSPVSRGRGSLRVPLGA